jgi:hypothetical protein
VVEINLQVTAVALFLDFAETWRRERLSKIVVINLLNAFSSKQCINNKLKC